MAFSASYSRIPLDPSQEEAARAERGPLLVGAGPGTGKTRTLTARVLYLIRETGVRPENLLALTFSRKAAEEMRERIGAATPDVARRAAICTFHAYGLDLLRRYWREASLPPQPVLLSMADAYALLERRAAELPLDALRFLHDPAFPLPDILRAVARAKEEMITPEEFARRAEALGDERLTEVAKVYALYEDLMREKGALDFSDLVYKALRLLEEDESVRRAEQEQWRHVLVDEYQDVNRAGARLVKALGGESGAGLWFVGDLRQSIYRFRGSSPENVARFEEDFPGGRRTELAVNYRSRPTLVALFGTSCGEGARTWSPARDLGEVITFDAVSGTPLPSPNAPAVLAVAPDEGTQHDYIAARARAFRDAGRRFGDIAVLCRTRGQANQARAALLARGVPVAVGDGAENDLLRAPDVKDLLALLARACEPNGPTRHRFPELPAGVPASGTADAYDFWTQTLWGPAGWARKITDPGAVAQLLVLARTFRERAGVVLEPDDDPKRAFLAHVRRLARLGQDLGRAASADVPAEDAPDPGVRVLTAHAAKGLEFPIVFLPNLSAGKFPARPGPSLLPPVPLADEPVLTPDESLAEESRLFFVALTRARDHLILSRAEKYNGRAAAPSPLLGCLGEALRTGLVVREEWQPSPPSPLPPRERGVEEGSPAASPTFPSPAAGEGGRGGEGPPVEAPDAELYLRCPKRFYYEKVADLAPSEPSAYGAFKRAVTRSLADSDPAAALEGHWEQHGPSASHPLHGLYRQMAEALVRRGATPQRAGQPAPPLPLQRKRGGEKKGEEATAPPPEPPALSVRLEHGTVSVRPDAATPDLSTVELHTFRRPPKDEKRREAPSEPRLSLLQEATGGDAQVRVRYLQGDVVLPAANSKKQREKHLAAYDRALSGIQLRVFDPAPSDTGDCPNCPYLFLCPEP